MTPLLSAGVHALSFRLDETALPYLALFATLWLLSGAYAAATVPKGRRASLFAYYIPSALGGIAVALAADAIAFYLCFALMAIPAWGLITHADTPEARRAGSIYLTLTVIGEAALLAALMLLVAETGTVELGALAAAIPASGSRDLIMAILLAAIGLKVGALPVSGVLPLSYTYTPAGAASALAGASVKVGALAMLRLLPAGGLPEGWAFAVMALGLSTAFVAALLGVLTTAPRAVLGYSSASQMGLVLVAAGVGLADPHAAPLAAAAVVAFSLHHGLAKSALILGDDVVARSAGRARTLALTGLALPALALVGLPVTSGFVAKYALKDALHALTGTAPHTVEVLLPWTAVGTAALMLRFFELTRRQAPASERARPAWMPAAVWVLLLVLVALTAWIWPAEWSAHAAASAFSPSSMWPALWPGLIAVALALLLRRIPRAASLAGTVPPGDWLGSAARLITSVFGRQDEAAAGSAHATRDTTTLDAVGRTALAGERLLVAWTVAAAAFVTLAVLLVMIATR